MKHAVICGAGKMGVAIGLAMRHLGYKLSIVETNNDSAKLFHNAHSVYHHWSQINSQVDIFISSLPYHATLDAAVWCIDNGIRYCDLGGSVPVSKDIREVSERDAKKPVMTDLGLAPGWINIIAEEMYQSLPSADTIAMMVGGIPPSPVQEDVLKYKVTWSLDGLLNEYEDDCVSLEDGRRVIVKGLSGLENVSINGMELEAFNTSGASSHTIDTMSARGVCNCYYKTLRWRGHCTLVKYLLSALDKNSIKSIFEHSSKHYKDDMVVLNVIAGKGHCAEDCYTLTKSSLIHAKDGLTAMQRATAFPLASVAHQLAKGQMDHKKYPTYSDIDLKMFNHDLDDLLSKVSLPAK